MKKIVSVLLVLCAVITLCPARAQAAESAFWMEGKCGDNIRWVFSNSHFLIEGTGEMYDYDTADEAPRDDWFFTRFGEEGRKAVKDIHVYPGVTRIGNAVFQGYSNVKELTIEEDTVSIGENAFSGCTALKKIYLYSADSLTRIEKDAFSGCTALKEVYFYGYRSQWKALEIEEGNECLTNAKINFRPLGDPDKSGQCGDDLQWAWYEDQKTFFLTGSGDMWDFDRYTGKEDANSSYTTAPWERYEAAAGRSSGKGLDFVRLERISANLVIEDDVTSFGDYAFPLYGFKTVEFPEGFTRLGYAALQGCDWMTEVHFPSSIREINSSAFYKCTALTDVYYAGSKSQWDEVNIGRWNGALTEATMHFAKTDAMLTVEGGSITDGSSEGMRLSGESITVTADAVPAGKHFAGWSGSDGLTFLAGDKMSETITFQMPEHDLTLVAEFADIEYSLTVEGGNGTGNYIEDAQVTVTADPALAGKQFEAWEGDVDDLTFLEGDANSASITFAMPAHDVQLAARYANVRYTLTVGNGTGGGKYVSSARVTVTADAAPLGMQFEKWIGNVRNLFLYEGDANSPTITFSMPARDTYLNASYVRKAYTLTVEGGVGGGLYQAGERVTVTATAAPEGKRFQRWSGSDLRSILAGSSLANYQVLTFTMPEHDVTLRATYRDDAVYEVTVKNGADGSETKKAYAAGDVVFLTADATSAGKRFRSWESSIQSENLLSGGTRDRMIAFVMPDRNVELCANYRIAR